MNSGRATLSLCLAALLIALLATFHPLPLFAQAGDQLLIEGGTLSLGAEGEFRVLCNNTDNIVGWNFGLCHDPSQLELLSVVEGSATASPPNPFFVDFYQVDTYADGITIAGLYFGPGTLFIPTGIDQELNILTYQAVATTPTVAEISFCDILGAPPVSNDFILTSGVTLTPAVVDASLSLTGEVFARGDADGNATINLIDALTLLAALFTGGAINCSDALDVNDDGMLTLIDAIALLNYLFASGAAPSAPSAACGIDPTVDSLDCATLPMCP